LHLGIEISPYSFCENIQIINNFYGCYNKIIKLLQNVTFIIDVLNSLGYNIIDVRIR